MHIRRFLNNCKCNFHAKNQILLLSYRCRFCLGLSLNLPLFLWEILKIRKIIEEILSISRWSWYNSKTLWNYSKYNSNLVICQHQITNYLIFIQWKTNLAFNINVMWRVKYISIIRHLAWRVVAITCEPLLAALQGQALEQGQSPADSGPGPQQAYLRITSWGTISQTRHLDTIKIKCSKSSHKIYN